VGPLMVLEELTVGIADLVASVAVGFGELDGL